LHAWGLAGRNLPSSQAALTAHRVGGQPLGLHGEAL